jgi:prepilin-type N-terminal cleavage/methylation domain-containing protein
MKKLYLEDHVQNDLRIRRSSQTKPQLSGFTLIELLVVIAIIAIGGVNGTDR